MYKSNAAERHSLEYLKTFRGMFADILRNIRGHPPECFTASLEMFYNIPQKVWWYFPECFTTSPGIFCDIPRMFGDFPQNVRRHSPEWYYKISVSNAKYETTNIKELIRLRQKIKRPWLYQKDFKWLRFTISLGIVKLTCFSEFPEKTKVFRSEKLKSRRTQQ